jgi:cysteine synthase A
MVANACGFRTIIVIPETQSVEKKDTLRLMGAELVEVPAVPYKNPNNYVRYSERLAAALAKSEPNGAVWANQFDNVANRDGHVTTTAEEIWRQTDGKIDGFVSAVGTGGTLAGVAAGLRARTKNVKIALADPPGAALYAYYTAGELKSEGSSITEGIGQGRITANLEGFKPDFAFQIPDAEAVSIVFDLLWQEGLCLGGSSGVNIAGSPASSVRATQSSRRSATTAHATNPSSSIPSSWPRKSFPCPLGSQASGASFQAPSSTPERE